MNKYSTIFRNHPAVRKMLDFAIEGVVKNLDKIASAVSHF